MSGPQEAGHDFRPKPLPRQPGKVLAKRPWMPWSTWTPRLVAHGTPMARTWVLPSREGREKSKAVEPGSLKKRQAPWVQSAEVCGALRHRAAAAAIGGLRGALGSDAARLFVFFLPLFRREAHETAGADRRRGAGGPGCRWRKATSGHAIPTTFGSATGPCQSESSAMKRRILQRPSLSWRAGAFQI